MLPEFISVTTSEAALWRAVKEKAKSLVRATRDAWLALPGCALVEAILKRLDFADERMQYLDWTDDYWHMPRYPYDLEEEI